MVDKVELVTFIDDIVYDIGDLNLDYDDLTVDLNDFELEMATTNTLTIDAEDVTIKDGTVKN